MPARGRTAAKDAATCAELMVRADLQGADGHGIFRLPQYVRRIKGGAVNVKPKVKVVREAAAWPSSTATTAWGTW